MGAQLDHERWDWQKDGFESYQDYQDYTVRFAEALYRESQEFWKSTKKGWYRAVRRLENGNADTEAGISRPTMTRLPLLESALEEAVATQVESMPRPQCTSRQATQDDFAAGLSYYMAEACDANGFGLMLARTITNSKKVFCGIIKTTVDWNQMGPLGKKGKIIFKNIDARNWYPDPYCNSYNWDDARFWCFVEAMDCAEIREQWPITGDKVKPESAYSTSFKSDMDPDDSTAGSREWSSPFNQQDSFILGERHRAAVKELWLKDERREWIPQLDEFDQPMVNPFTGEPEGQWKKRFPNGRCIIWANGVLLADFPNPYRHKRPPYAFFPSRIGGPVLQASDLQYLMRIEDKINLLQQDMMRNARANMNQPWITDTKTFPSKEMYKRLTNNPGEVLIKNPGGTLERLPPGDMPAYVLPLIDWLRGIFDDVLGISSIMRGQIEKGAQLSADAISGLQGSATSRLKLKARLIEEGLKELGYQLQWLIRDTYPTGLKIKIIDPADQTPKEIAWNDMQDQDDWAVTVQSGSSLPGAKQGAAEQALTLYEQDAIDRKALLAAFDIPNAAEIDERMAKKEMARLMLDLLTGKSSKQQSSHPNPSGKPGRKHKI